MPIFRRELAFNMDRPGENARDWWHLVLDTDAPGLYIEHKWEHRNIHSSGGALEGFERYGINDFLTLAQGEPAQPALMGALKEMFGDAEHT
jgi:hypothetical protein